MGDEGKRSGGIDRRDFLGFGAGAAGLFCALSTKDIPNLNQRDVKQIDAAAKGLRKPKSARAGIAGAKGKKAALPAGFDKVDNYGSSGDDSVPVEDQVFRVAEPAEGGTVREYWIQATSAWWNPVPTGLDNWMGMKHSSRPFLGFMYQEMESGFSAPKQYDDGSYSLPSMPGPTLEGEVGDVLEVHFRNAEDQYFQAVTMHPHGVRYTPDYDGIYLNDFTRAGGFIAPGEEFTYRWECLESSVGAWAYHDHGPNHILNSARGLFGSLVIRPKDAPTPDREYFRHLHSLAPAVSRQMQMLHAINGRSYAGNTPTMRAKVGDTVAIHVFGMNSDFHTFHMHGHRWPDHAGVEVDSPTIGPAESLSLHFTEDNPGRWLYHCHVSGHQDSGMAGWYLVEA